MVVPTIRVSHWDHVLMKKERQREREREREMRCTPSTKGKFARLAFSDARGEQ